MPERFQWEKSNFGPMQKLNPSLESTFVFTIISVTVFKIVFVIVLVAV
jgi:hypothetical protein